MEIAEYTDSSDTDEHIGLSVSGKRRKSTQPHDWGDFATFCRRHGLEALPAVPQTLALYLKSLESKTSQSPAGLRSGTPGLSVSTIRRRLAAVASKHATEKLETPTDHPLVKKLVRRYSRSRERRRRRRTRLPSSGFQQY